ncbi:major capsid protein [Cytobacillus pseudoceanisediminis]|uniref:major capsid protein n=1 Tax=Cytobacillus pseudoceanisediminis TaxID=3051614 RepID=UPI003CFB1BCF
MALTLEQAAKLSTDKLQRGVIETFARTSPVLELLPFMTIAGNSYQYNQEKTLPNIEYRGINEAYTEGAGEVVRKSESLVMLGGDVDVDKFIVKTLGNVNDQRAIQTQMKVKALSKQFTKDFFKGDSENKTNNKFDGLDVRIAANGQAIFGDNAGSAAAVLTLNKLHELLDMVEGGADALFMSKAMRREMQKLLEGQTHYVQVGKDNFGRPIEFFGDVAIRTVEDDVLPFTESIGDGLNDNATTGSIYAVKFGAQEAIAGLTNGGVMVDDLGEIDAKPVYRTRIEFYCGMADFHPKAAARLAGIKRA